MALDDLLTPSLASARDVRSLYSVRACFLVAFFGGVYGAVVMGVANSLRAQRLLRDWPLYLLAVLAWTAFLWWYTRAVFLGAPPPWAELFGKPSRTLSYVGRAVGLACFGLIYLRHRVLFRAAETLGVAAPSPWKIGILAVAVGAVATAGLAAIGAGIPR